MLALPNTVYLVGILGDSNTKGGLIPAVLILIIVPSWIVYCTKLITDCFCAFDTKPKADEDPYVLLAEKVGFLNNHDLQAFGKFGVFLLQCSFVITVYGIAVAYEVSLVSISLPVDHLERPPFGSSVEGMGSSLLLAEVVLGCRVFLPRVFSCSPEGPARARKAIADG